MQSKQTQADLDSTHRFSNRVENYVRYRPGYPAGILDLMRHEMGLNPASVIADIGSGTGISARFFLQQGNTVFAVEPNDEMRAAAERDLASFDGFRSIAASAETTSLADHSIDIVVALQAFHWFDRASCRREFQRILRPGGWGMLAWNERQLHTTPFLREYEALVATYASDYNTVRHENITASMLGEFYGPGGFRLERFDNHQTFEFAGFEGRLMSSSYIPIAGPRHDEMLKHLRTLFDQYAVDGHVRFDYDTRVYFGRLD